MKTLIVILVLFSSYIFSYSAYSETIKLECVCQKMQMYDIVNDQIIKDQNCVDSTSSTGEWIEYVYLNPKEKWIIPRGSENTIEKREVFTEITDDYFYTEFKISNDKMTEWSRNQAIKEGKKTVSEIFYFIKIDRYTLTMNDGSFFSDYNLKEKEYAKPESKGISTFFCKKINQQL